MPVLWAEGRMRQHSTRTIYGAAAAVLVGGISWAAALAGSPRPSAGADARQLRALAQRLDEASTPAEPAALAVPAAKPAETPKPAPAAAPRKPAPTAPALPPVPVQKPAARSEERRVGKEGRAGWARARG